MLRLFLAHRRVFAFCVLTTSSAVPAQTLGLSFFIPYIENLLGSSRSSVAAMYTIATVAGAFAMPILGTLLDRASLKRYVVIASLIVVSGFLVLANVNSLPAVLVCFILMRSMGQGGFVLSAKAVSARFQGAHRGKALGITGLGHPIGETLFPFIIAYLLHHFGFRSSAYMVAGFYAFVYFPISYFLVTKAKLPTGYSEKITKKNTPKNNKVFRDYRFYLLFFPAALMPFLVAGIFYHQASLTEMKNWPPTAVPLGISFFAVLRGVFSLIVGFVIDRYSARTIFPFHLVPLLLAVIIGRYVDHYVAAVLIFALIGVCMGMAGNLVIALWSEVYGAHRIGRIQGFSGGGVTGLSALTPFLFGFFLDVKLGWETIFLFSGIVLVLGLFIGKIGIWLYRKD